MSIRWVLRDKKRHGKRLVVLVDAQAVLGAAARGRSSANTIKREMRRYGALVFGGDFGRACLRPERGQPGRRSFPQQGSRYRPQPFREISEAIR